MILTWYTELSFLRNKLRDYNSFLFFLCTFRIYASSEQMSPIIQEVDPRLKRIHLKRHLNQQLHENQHSWTG